MNQALLIDNKNLLDFINNLMSIDFNQKSNQVDENYYATRSVKIQLIYEGVKFLNSMIAGNNDREKLER